MKKLIALGLAVITAAFTLTACDKGSSDSDLAAIEKAGKMVIGITEYEPMNYYDDNGELIGFDTEFAKEVCELLGVEADFQIIDWDMKETELKAKNIDCIWNGLTVTEDRKENMDFTDTYLANKQCIIINKKSADKLSKAEGYDKDTVIAAESGSAGETAIADNENLSKCQYVAADSQQAALLGLLSGNYDAIVVDYTLGNASVGRGDYADMQIVDSIELEDELYAIGFRLGSDLTAKVNELIKSLRESGVLADIAAKYNVTDLYEQAVQ